MPDLDEQPLIVDVTLKRHFVPSFEEYPYSIPAIHELHTLKLHPKVTYFIGENGSGKSTLLEAIAAADGINPEGGTRNFNLSTRDSHSELYRNLTLGKGLRRARHDSFFLRAENFYNLATFIDGLGFDPATSPYGPKSLHDQSHGEAFMTLFLQRFSRGGLYLLDEPESALSPQRQLTFLAAMHDLCLRGAQWIIATHSPIIMAYPGELIYHFSDSGIQPIEYEDTEHYKVTRSFLTRRERMLANLFAEDD